jgi:hypothetical protein
MNGSTIRVGGVGYGRDRGARAYAPLNRHNTRTLGVVVNQIADYALCSGPLSRSSRQPRRVDTHDSLS